MAWSFFWEVSLFLVSNPSWPGVFPIFGCWFHRAEVYARRTAQPPLQGHEMVYVAPRLVAEGMGDGHGRNEHVWVEDSD